MLPYFYIFIASLCSFSYEFLLANIYSNIFKDITFFSFSIMLYLLGLGFGTKFNEQFHFNLIPIEISLILLAIFSPIFILYAELISIEIPYVNIIVLFLLNMFFGVLTGIEFSNILKRFQQKFSISLFWNYISSLASSILIQFVLINYISSEHMFLFFAIINLFFLLLLLKDNYFKALPILLLFALPINLIGKLHFEIASKNYNEENVIYTRVESKYQIIEKVRSKYSVQLFLNGDLQFDSLTEQVYHKNLVLRPIYYHLSQIKKVLLLGAGDGLALRELNKFNFDITHVELDKTFQNFAKNDPDISKLNKGSLEKINTIFTDAYNFVKYDLDKYDLIIIDFPFPTNYELSRLYSLEFYKNIYNRLNENALVVLDAPINPYYDGMHLKDISMITQNNSLIFNTLKHAGFKNVVFYDEGNEGFVIAYNGDIKADIKKLNQLKYPIDLDYPVNTVFRFQNFNFINKTY